MYKGKYVYTITKDDIGTRYKKLGYCGECGTLKGMIDFVDLMGDILSLDVGKQIYLIDNIYCVENDEQLKERLKG